MTGLWKWAVHRFWFSIRQELRSEGVLIQDIEVRRMLMCDNSRRRKEGNEGGRPLRGTRRSSQGKDPERPNQVNPAGDQRDCPLRRTSQPIWLRTTPQGSLATWSSRQRAALPGLPTSVDRKWMLRHWGTESRLQALVQAVNAILQPSSDSLLQALQQLRVSIQDMTGTLGQMHGTCAWCLRALLVGKRAWRLGSIQGMVLLC